jgi:hypothetical protein
MLENLEKRISRIERRDSQSSVESGYDLSEHGDNDNESRHEGDGRELMDSGAGSWNDEESPTAEVCLDQPEFIERRWCRESNQWVHRKVDEKVTKAEKKLRQSQINCFVWKRFLDRRGQETRACVTINCLNLRKVLAKELKGYPLHSMINTEDWTFYSPFFPLLHNWKQLEDAASREVQGSERCSSHLQCLLRVVRQCKLLSSYFDSLDRQEHEKVVSFDHLDKLFWPGRLVYATPYNLPQAFLVSSTTREIRGRARQSTRYLMLYCWTYEFNGTMFSREPFTVAFKAYDGVKKITSLRCYPLDYYEPRPGEKQSIHESLRERGEWYRHCCIQEKQHMMFDYHGDASVVVDRLSTTVSHYGEALTSTILQVGLLYERARSFGDVDESDEIDATQKSIENLSNFAVT